MYELTPRVEIAQPYDTDKVTNLIVNSFRFSRGSSTLHSAILLHLADSFGDRLTDENISESIPGVVRAAERYTSNPHLHVKLHKEVIEEEVAERAKYLTEAVGHNLVSNRDELLGLILEADIVKMPGYDNIDSISEGRPYKSNFVTYGLLGRSTRSEEYDSMFKSVADTYRKHQAGYNVYIWPDNALTHVPKIIDTHLQAHPEDAGVLQKNT